jgi:hypothetical protein
MKRPLKEAADPCAWPARAKGVSPPKLMELPERVIGCTYAAHGHSSARSKEGPEGRSALSVHPSVSNKTTLFNVHAPVLFHDAKLIVSQAAARASAKTGKVEQVITWPKKRACVQDADCNSDKQETCKRPKGKLKGKCASARRVKAPMGYVVGKVAPDDGVARARNIAFWPGELRDGTWISAKFVETTCPDFPKNQAACPAVTSAKIVRFFPNFADGKSPQPFSVTLEGDKRRRKRRR